MRESTHNCNFDNLPFPNYDTGMNLRQIPRTAFYVILAVLLLTRSTLPSSDPTERVRAYTRSIEFDFISWTLNAFGVKVEQNALGTSNYIPLASRPEIVLDYLKLLQQVWDIENQVNEIYADPKTQDPQSASASLRQELEKLKRQKELTEPLAESVLQAQINLVAADMGLTLGGQPIPSILYRTTPPPDALIVSPRNNIRQDYDISIAPDLTIDQITKLEDQVDHKLNLSSLVVGIGGIGLYPTMVQETTDINWLAEVVSHEWTHNFLTLRPLGASFEVSPELRTINETTASLAGKEIGREVISRYYPQYLPPPPVTAPPSEQKPAEPKQPPAFDFQTEMRITRVTTDQLLAEGKIAEAEAYMEQRRQFLWDNGYHIRKINQAYFAFYGAYADQPGGAAGVDPVGGAVRDLRAHSSSLAAFLNKISWIWSYQQLKQLVGSK